MADPTVSPEVAVARGVAELLAELDGCAVIDRQVVRLPAAHVAALRDALTPPPEVDE